MSAQTLPNQLGKMGRRLVRWHAQLRLTWCLAAFAILLGIAGFADLWLRWEGPGRFFAWAGLVAAALVACILYLAALRKRYSPDGVAAMIEKEFPELDSRLINFLQFSRSTGADAFRKAYVESGEPHWKQLDLGKMRNRQAHRRSQLALVATALLLAAPVLFFGQAWGVALWRTVNPFAATPPATLTRIISVDPGNASVLQGRPLVLNCTVKGFPGHEVGIEIDSGDAGLKHYALGKIAGSNEERFSHRIPKVTTALRYRVRAGDAPKSAWFTLETRPLPAFTSLEFSVTPPANTRLAPRRFDARQSGIVIPAGSQVAITARANSPLQSAAAKLRGGESVSLTAAGPDQATWQGSLRVDAGEVFHLSAKGELDSTLDEDIGFALHPDKVPLIEILSPAGRAVLPPGERPKIQFRVADDYGLTQVALEEIPATGDGDAGAKGKVCHTWPVSGRTFEASWSSEQPVRETRLSYRLVATDDRPGTPNRAISEAIIFTAPGAADAARERNRLEEQALAGLQKIVELQKQNIAQTEQQRKAIDTTPGSAWETAAQRQQDIREQTRALLANPVEPLGGLTAGIKKLYADDMLVAVDSLKSIPGLAAPLRPAKATEAVTLENKILRALTHAESAAAQAKVERRLSGITAMLEALVRDQLSALEQTRQLTSSKAPAGKKLIDSQDALAEDLSALVSSCNEEAGSVKGHDPAFAATLENLARQAESLKIREDMVLAAERLSDHKPHEAVPLQEHALANLKTLQALLGDVQLKEDREKRDTMLEAVAQAKEKVGKVRDLHEKILDAMDQVRGMKDKNTEATDAMEEAYEELVANSKEVMLQVPTDLHVFTDLNVANDLVEDVFSVFEEVEQMTKSETMSPKDVIEQAYAKEEQILDMMKEAEGRLDDMEMWLGKTPDNIKVTTETYDREEMPESGIATGALSTQVQDMIGDLMDEQKDMADQADDGATTHAMPDMPMGWEVMEGNISSFAAKGKSGNDTPDHKEQDGRSNVGRQGMSNGETAASSGTISEGDKNIEARRTEDPTQSGQVALSGQADTRATGGGKLGTGKADGKGMSGGAERIDSNEAGSSEGMAALMARQADAVYAKASMKNIRVDSLKEAAHHLRTAADAVAKGDIQQVKEQRRLAAAALRRAQAELESGPSSAMQETGSAGVLDNVIHSGPDSAPPTYRGQVADYFKALNKEL